MKKQKVLLCLLCLLILIVVLVATMSPAEAYWVSMQLGVVPAVEGPIGIWDCGVINVSPSCATAQAESAPHPPAWWPVTATP